MTARTHAPKRWLQRPAGRYGDAEWHRPQWWPALAGAAFAAFVALDLFRGEEEGRQMASIVAASGLVYLAAAAMREPAAAWWTFFASVLVITAAKIGWVGIDATWILLVWAGLLFAYGSLRGGTTQPAGLTLQTAAMVGFGAAAALALYLDEASGAYMVAAGLLAHAAWDVYHHWTNSVVGRSMAEFCCVLDTLLALAIIVATVPG